MAAPVSKTGRICGNAAAAPCTSAMSCSTHRTQGPDRLTHHRECLFSFTVLAGLSFFQLVINIFGFFFTIIFKDREFQNYFCPGLSAHTLLQFHILSEPLIYFGCVALRVSICRGRGVVSGLVYVPDWQNQTGASPNLARALKANLVFRICCFYKHLFLSQATF